MNQNVNDYAIGKCKTEGDIEIFDFTKNMPYILDLTFYKYEFEKMIRGCTICKFNETY